MKAVIVECSNGAAVALCDDGTFRKLKNKGYSIGQELLIKQRRSSNRMVQKLSICASLALVLLSFAGIGSHSYVEPYSYVSLDINPSIEYALNRYDKVISVAGINTEGQQVVSSIESDIKNQNITTALGVTIGQLEKDHYINQEGYNHVIVSVYSSNDTKAQSITSRVNTFSAEKSDICSIDTIPVSKEEKDDADSLGITPGKLALIHAVAETSSDSNFDVSQWTDKTVSELETTIQQASSQNPDSNTEPAVANVVNNDNAANKPDSSTSAAMDAVQEAGSASADKQPTTTDDIPTGSDSDNHVSAEKPDNSSNTITPASDDSTDSAAKPSTSDPSNTGSSDTANENPSDKDTSSNKDESSGTSSSKKPAASDNTSSPEKGESSSDSGSSNANDNLTEDSSSKKDSYPSPDTTTSEENPAEDQLQEDTASKNYEHPDSSQKDVSDVSNPDTLNPTAPNKAHEGNDSLSSNTADSQISNKNIGVLNNSAENPNSSD